MILMLKILSKIYSFAASSRRALYEKGIITKKKLPIPVISVGNLSVGGTGKTPLTIFIAKSLQKKGYRVCVLSRGYKRKSKGTLIVGDEKKVFLSPEKAGDEPYLIAKKGIPVVVSSSRYDAGIKALKEIKPDVFILDDGFQHFQLHRDIDILVFDAVRPFWEDRPLPEGKLREPEQFYRYADIIVVNRYERLSKTQKEKLLKKLNSIGKKYFITEERINSLTDLKERFPLSILEGENIGIFSGLGNNRQFLEIIRNLSKKYRFEIMREKTFPDHYSYKDIKLESPVDRWITTEKDIIKIPEKYIKKYNILAVEYSIENKELAEYLGKKLKSRKEIKHLTGEER